MNSSRRLFSSVVLLASLLLIIAAGQQATALRGITAEDYFAFEFVSDPHISPDGKTCRLCGHES